MGLRVKLAVFVMPIVMTVHMEQHGMLAVHRLKQEQLAIHATMGLLQKRVELVQHHHFPRTLLM
jgi:hypothetical protein